MLTPRQVEAAQVELIVRAQPSASNKQTVWRDRQNRDRYRMLAPLTREREVEHRQTWTCSTRSLGRLAFAQDQRVVIVVRVAASVAVAVFRADQARVQTQATRASGKARSAVEVRASR